MVRRGDILMTAAGATIGKSTTYLNDSAACYAGFLVRFRPGPQVIPRFIAYWMQSQPYWDQINIGAVRSTIDNFSAGKYRDLHVLLPPLEEQRRITDFLDDQVALLDRAVALRQTQVELSKEQQASYLQLVVTGQQDVNEPLVSGRLPWATQTPVSWPISKIVHHARLGSGHTPSRSRPEWWVDCNIPWITTGEVAQIRDDRVEVLQENCRRRASS